MQTVLNNDDNLHNSNDDNNKKNDTTVSTALYLIEHIVLELQN